MKPVLAALALALFAGSAHAALAPQYYKQARDQAPNVVVIDIVRVDPPVESFGDCRVKGTVRQVERGTLFVNGQTILLSVPCKTGEAQVPAGPRVWQFMGELLNGRPARAWIGPGGELALDQFEVLH